MTAYPHTPFDDVKPQTANQTDEKKLHRKKQLKQYGNGGLLSGRE